MRIPGLGELALGDESRGLCGGMAFAVRDFFEAGRVPPAMFEPPALGSTLYRYLVRRLFDSFQLPHGPLRYYHWMNLPDEDRWHQRGLTWRTVVCEWPKLRSALDQGKLTSLGLVLVRSANPLEMGNNHQVLAYGYDLDPVRQVVLVSVYDPNYPDDDTLTLSIQLGAMEGRPPIVYSSGSPVRGFFTTRNRGKSRLPDET